MTDREKVIRALENCTAEVKCRDCPWEECEELDHSRSEYPDGLVKDALALLKAQEPVESTLACAEEYDRHGSWWYQCGNCEMPIDPKDRYCRHCGRAVEWDG